MYDKTLMLKNSLRLFIVLLRQIFYLAYTNVVKKKDNVPSWLFPILQ